jgi:hypothetical protein
MILLTLLWPMLLLPLTSLGHSCIVMVSAADIAGDPVAAVVLTAVDVPGFPYVTKVSAVAAVSIAVD